MYARTYIIYMLILRLGVDVFVTYICYACLIVLSPTIDYKPNLFVGHLSYETNQ